MDRNRQGEPTLASTTSSGQYQAYDMWDAPTRWFHWINALAVFGLIVVGVILLNDDALGLGRRWIARGEGTLDRKIDR